MCFFDTNDQSTPSRINNFCCKHNIVCADASSLSNQITINEIASLNPDIIFNINNDWILSRPILKSAKIGTINFHNSPLPLYRGHGHAVLFWAIFNGESQYGVTLHVMEPGVDTGDIIVQGINLFENVLKDLLTGNYRRLQ